MKYFIFALMLAGCAGAPLRQVAATPTVVSPEPSFPIIDAHAHFQSDITKIANQPDEKIKASYKAANVVGAVAIITKEEQLHPPTVKNDDPIHFAVCAAAAPPQTAKVIEKGIKDGRYTCLKIYLAYVPKWASDPYYKQFYKLAEKYNIPIIFHTGDPLDKMAPVKYADPLTVDEIAVTYPKVTFVIAHMGNPWFDTAAEVIYKNDNVYADLSALMIGDLTKSDPDSIEELIVKPVHWAFRYIENPKKLMFGTDYPLITDLRPYIDALKRAIPKESWEDVFFNNANRVFKMNMKK